MKLLAPQKLVVHPKVLPEVQWTKVRLMNESGRQVNAFVATPQTKVQIVFQWNLRRTHVKCYFLAGKHRCFVTRNELVAFLSALLAVENWNGAARSPCFGSGHHHPIGIPGSCPRWAAPVRFAWCLQAAPESRGIAQLSGQLSGEFSFYVPTD